MTGTENVFDGFALSVFKRRRFHGDYLHWQKRTATIQNAACACEFAGIPAVHPKWRSQLQRTEQQAGDAIPRSSGAPEGQRPVVLLFRRANPQRKDLERLYWRVACAAFTCLQLDGAICGRDIRSIAARARDLRIIRTSSLEIELIQKLTAVQLIVLDAQSGSLVRIAQKLLRGDGFFIPCELQLQV